MGKLRKKADNTHSVPIATPSAIAASVQTTFRGDGANAGMVAGPTAMSYMESKEDETPTEKREGDMRTLTIEAIKALNDAGTAVTISNVVSYVLSHTDGLDQDDVAKIANSIKLDDPNLYISLAEAHERWVPTCPVCESKKISSISSLIRVCDDCGEAGTLDEFLRAE